MTPGQAVRRLFDQRGWLRAVAGGLVLVAVALIQSPGYLVADTKFDLAVDPVGFLGRALHLWDGSGAMGQLQNQAYGYLWPMGPFFVGGDLIGMPGWVTQRLWLALVLVVAFLGAMLVARALGVTSDVACLLAGFAYALSPRMLSTVGPISIEAWPSSVAPWVLLPLVLGCRFGSPRRAAAWSAVAIGMVGGVNAAATFAVIPLGVVWLLTRSRGPRRTSMIVWWPLFTALATAWWLIPLFLLGAYSPPFLDYIEAASITTFPTTLTDSLRGTSAWVPYIDGSWRGGSLTVRQGHLAVSSAVVILTGLLGLLWRGNPHRRFLAIGLGVGLVMVTLGHQGAVQGWFSGPARDALDGALAPIRNVHKFDPIIRLPLVLGLAFFCEFIRHREAGDGRVAARVGYTALAVVAVIGAAMPALTGALSPLRPVLEVPPYWSEAADWLDERDDGSGGSLLLPGSGFADYAWGAPRDEPLQYLASSPWAVRNAVPLTSPGNIRMLDSLERAITTGRGSPGLEAALSRAGIRYLVVRNDLNISAEGASPALVYQALGRLPTVERVATFGPRLDGAVALQDEAARYVSDGGWRTSRYAVEVFELPDVDAATVTSGEIPVVVGGPEDLLDVLDADLVGEEPTVLGYDADATAELTPRVLTDGFVARERFFGRVHHASSAVLGPGDVRRTGNPTRDYLPSGTDLWQSRASLLGARAISASSSMSDAEAFGRTQPGQNPYAAVDPLLETQWVSGQLVDGAPWWRIDLEDPASLSAVDVVVGVDSDDNIRIRARTDQGAGTAVTVGPLERRRLDVPPGSTEQVMIEVLGDGGDQLALADVRWTGRSVERPVVLPELPEPWGSPASILLRSMQDEGVSGCVDLGTRTPCLEQQVVHPEEIHGIDRTFTLPQATAYDWDVRARPRAGSALDELILGDSLVRADASTVGVPDPRGGALAAIDADRGTAWTARIDDPVPSLQLNWLAPQRLESLALTTDDDAPVRGPVQVSLNWPRGEAVAEVGDDGTVELPRVIRTEELTIRILEGEAAASIDANGDPSALPIGVSEVFVNGASLPGLGLSTRERDLGCGTGPDLTVNDQTWSTALRASSRQLFEGEQVEARPCAAGVASDGADVELTAGENRVSSASSDVAMLDALTLRTDATEAGAPAAPVAPVEVERPDAARVRMDVPGAGTLALRQNFNRGWAAAQGDLAYEPVVLDGWQQGWTARAVGDGPVTARFVPDGPYRIALAGGLACWALLVLGLVVTGRRRSRTTSTWLPVGTGSPSPAAVRWIGVAALGGVLAGWPGAVVAAIGVGMAVVVAPTREEVYDDLIWLLALPAAVAVGAYLVAPWGSSDTWAGEWAWPHYLVVLGVSVVLALAAAPFELPQRMAGRSTHR